MKKEKLKIELQEYNGHTFSEDQIVFVLAELDHLLEAKIKAIGEMKKEGTGIGAIPATNDFANGWNDCRKRAFEMKNEVLDLAISILKQ